MKTTIVLLFSVTLSSCAIIYSGVVENRYPDEVIVDTPKDIKGYSIVKTKESVEIPIFETEKGTCMSVTHDSKKMFFQVPAPPKWAKITGHWDVKFRLVVSPDGAFYMGRDNRKLKLTEVASCGT